MGKKFNLEDYKKAVQESAIRAAQSVIQNDILPDLQHSVRRMIKEEVYDSYTPTQYERRGEAGGLLDSNHIVTDFDGFHARIRSTASPAPSLFGTPITSNPMLIDWMDEGSIARLSRVRFPRVRFQPWIKDRKGIKKRIAYDIVVDGALTSKIADGLRRETHSKVRIK